MIGEIRDRETMQAAISYAETGHLCLSTLHSNNANQTLERIINFFPEDARSQLLLDLSLNLQAVVSLRLLQGVGGHRIPAVEILLKSPYVSDLIAMGEVDLLKEAMKSAADRNRNRRRNQGAASCLPRRRQPWLAGREASLRFRWNAQFLWPLFFWAFSRTEAVRVPIRTPCVLLG